MTTVPRGHLYIEEHLRAVGLSDEKASELLGVQRETVFRWRTEQHRLDPEKVLQIADLCGVEPEALYRLPQAESVDQILRDAPDNIRNAVIELAKRLLGTPLN